MDSFFVSVELLKFPELRGKPVAIANESSRSVVSSASYEARKYGVRSAMPSLRAKQLCPSLIFVPPNMAEYRAASKRIMQIFERYTPLVEPLSIDEAFLDVSGAFRLHGTPVEIAHKIREDLKNECGLPATVGIASTKFVAKLASDYAKPDGLLEIPHNQTLAFLHSLPVENMWGVGKVTAKQLKSRAIHTVAQLAAEPQKSLESIVGKAAALKLHQLAQGIDPRHVETNTNEKSIGHESTFATDLIEPEKVERELLRLSIRTAARLRDLGVKARTVAIKVRWAGFETSTRSRTLTEPSNTTQRIYDTAKELYGSLNEWGRPVRLVGVRGEGLVSSDVQASLLWDEDEHLKNIDSAVDTVRERYGATGITPARLINNPAEKNR